MEEEEEEVWLSEKCKVAALFNDIYLKTFWNIWLTALLMITSLGSDRSHGSLWRDPGSERYRTFLERRRTLISVSHSTSVSFYHVWLCLYTVESNRPNQTPPHFLHCTAWHGTRALSYFRPVTVDYVCLWWETPSGDGRGRVLQDAPILIVPRFLEYLRGWRESRSRC